MYDLAFYSFHENSFLSRWPNAWLAAHSRGTAIAPMAVYDNDQKTNGQNIFRFSVKQNWCVRAVCYFCLPCCWLLGGGCIIKSHRKLKNRHVKLTESAERREEKKHTTKIIKHVNHLRSCRIFFLFLLSCYCHSLTTDYLADGFFSQFFFLHRFYPYYVRV